MSCVERKTDLCCSRPSLWLRPARRQGEVITLRSLVVLYLGVLPIVYVFFEWQFRGATRSPKTITNSDDFRSILVVSSILDQKESKGVDFGQKLNLTSM